MIITNTSEFGQILRSRRKKLNYTQSQVSEITGFSTSFISELENGKETAELGKAIYLATMLGIDLSLKERG